MASLIDNVITSEQNVQIVIFFFITRCLSSYILKVKPFPIHSLPSLDGVVGSKGTASFDSSVGVFSAEDRFVLTVAATVEHVGVEIFFSSDDVFVSVVVVTVAAVVVVVELRDVLNGVSFSSTASLTELLLASTNCITPSGPKRHEYSSSSKVIICIEDVIH